MALSCKSPRLAVSQHPYPMEPRPSSACKHAAVTQVTHLTISASRLTSLFVNENLSIYTSDLPQRISRGLELGTADAALLMSDLLSGDLAEESIVALLSALNERGYRAEELTGFAEEMLSQCTTVSLGQGSSRVVDIVGTGGSVHARNAGINVSTMACFVAAAAGVTIAKHGNRKASSTSGSFDFLEVLGVDFSESASEVERLINEKGLAFIFARNFHPALASVTVARQRLGVPTIFNLLGPVCNPAQPSGIVLGANSLEAAELLAQVLLSRKIEHGLVLFGHDGIDELSLSAETTIFEVRDESLIETVVSPAEFGLQLQIQPSGGDANHNLRIFNELRAGELGPAGLLIAGNAGLAIYVSGLSDSIKNGIETAIEVIRTGRLDRYVESYLN